MKAETEALINRIDAMAERYRQRLNGLQDDAERELVRIFSRAEGGVLGGLRNLLRQDKINIDQATVYLADIDRMLQRVLVTGGKAWVESQFSLAYELAVDRVRDGYLAGEGFKAGVSNLRFIDDDAIRSALMNFTPADDAVFRSGLKRGYNLVREIDSELSNHLRDVLTRNVALGTDTNTIAAEIMEGGRLKPIGRFSLEQRAQMIARTELARVNEEAAAVRSAQVGIELFRWSAMVGDPRTGDDSLRRHGRIKTREQWLVYKPDQFKGVPPIRPNDRCEIVPMKRSWIRDREAREEFDHIVKEDGRHLVSESDRENIAIFEAGQRKKFKRA